MWTYYLKLSWLSIKKTPVLSALMVLTVAVGIGTCLTTLTMYSVISGNPMAHKNDRLFAVQLDAWDPDDEYAGGNHVPPQLTYQDAMAIYESRIPDKTVIMRKSGLTVQKTDMSGTPSTHKTRMTTRDFFSMFDVVFVYGGPWDDDADLNRGKVVVINETVNNQLFEGKDSVGEPLLLEGELFTVVGVVDDDWALVPKVYDLNNGPFDTSAHIYVPFSNVANREYQTWGNMNNWSAAPINSYREFLASESIWIQAWVELSSPEQQREFARFLEGYIKQQKQNGRFQRPLKYALSTPGEWLAINETVSSDNRVLVGLSLAFLLVCLVNTVVMLLAKFLRKAPEAGIRRALGASRRAIFSQHVFEALAIGVAGGLLGLVFSWFGLAGVRDLFGNYDKVAVMNLYTVAMSLSLAVIASLVSGALPAWRVSSTQPAKYLNTQ